jgi:hypothetical protein
MKLLKTGFAYCIVLIMFTGCTANLATPSETPQSTSTATPSSSPLAELANFDSAAQATLEALKNKDMNKLSEIVHPEKGVQLSPYGNINVIHDVTIGYDELIGLLDDTSVVNWGEYDGSGESIELTFSDYYNTFIFDQDYTTAPKVKVNEAIGEGNTLNNLFTLYPIDKYKTIEYHFDQIDPKNAGMDWVSLRLVFEQLDGTWRIVAIVHDQWTI